MAKLNNSNKGTTSVEELIHAYLRDNPEIRELLSLIRMSEEEYRQALLAYRLPLADVPTIASTHYAKQDVNVSATTRQPSSAS